MSGGTFYFYIQNIKKSTSGAKIMSGANENQLTNSMEP